MKSEHLTHEEAQGYAENVLGPRQESAAAHLETCGNCRALVRQYELLFRGLKDETGFELPAGFAGSVAAKVAPQRTLSRYGGLIWSLAGSAAAVCLVYCFIDMWWLGELVSSILFGAGGMADSVASALQAVDARLPIRSGLLVVPVLILLVVTALDRIILGIRHSKAMFLAL